MPQWKKMVTALAESNMTNGLGMVDHHGSLFLAPPPGHALENRTADDACFQCDGPEIPRKSLRGWIWKAKGVVEKGEEAVLWSVYDPETNKTSVGLSVMVREEVSDAA